MYLYPCLAICQVNVMCVADCIVSLRHKKLIQKQSLLKHIRIWVMGICFAAICFLLNIVLTGFIKKILVLVMIWLNMGVCLKTAINQDATAHLERLEAVLFPRPFTVYLAVYNMFCLSINGSRRSWNKCCINTAGKDCLCLDYTLSYVSCALPTVKLLSSRDFLSPPVSSLLSSLLGTGQLHMTETSDCSSQVTMDCNICLYSVNDYFQVSCSHPNLLHIERLQDWKLKGNKHKMARRVKRGIF